MACSSCGGGRALTNRPMPTPQIHQSPQRIVVNPGKASGQGFSQNTSPNKGVPPPTTKRTTV